MIAAIRTHTLPVLAIGAIALTGCNNSETVTAKDASVEEVAEKVAKVDVKPQPGRWESRLQFTKIEMAGMPPQVQEAMKAQMGKEQKWLSCLTPEQANANNGEFFKPENSEACTYNSFSMGGGKITADMTCSEGGASQNMKMSGTYGSDAYDMEMNSEGSMEGNKVSMAMAVSAKRVGECDGTEPS